MPRTAAEKAKIEKRVRIEKTLIPIICVLGLAVFIVMSALMGKNAVQSSELSGTPSPTEDPCYPLIRSMAKDLDGTVTEGDGFAAVSYPCSLDGKDVVVSAYTKKGVLCMQLTGCFPLSHKEEETAAPSQTQSMFVIDNTPAPSQTTAATAAPSFDDADYDKEILKCLSYLSEPKDRESSLKQIKSALNVLASGKAKKSSCIYGIYLVEFSWSEADSILKMICEPI